MLDQYDQISLNNILNSLNLEPHDVASWAQIYQILGFENEYLKSIINHHALQIDLYNLENNLPQLQDFIGVTKLQNQREFDLFQFLIKNHPQTCIRQQKLRPFAEHEEQAIPYYVKLSNDGKTLLYVVRKRHIYNTITPLLTAIIYKKNQCTNKFEENLRVEDVICAGLDPKSSSFAVIREDYEKLLTLNLHMCQDSDQYELTHSVKLIIPAYYYNRQVEFFDSQNQKIGCTKYQLPSIFFTARNELYFKIESFEPVLLTLKDLTKESDLKLKSNPRLDKYYQEMITVNNNGSCVYLRKKKTEYNQTEGYHIASKNLDEGKEIIHIKKLYNAATIPYLGLSDNNIVLQLISDRIFDEETDNYLGPLDTEQNLLPDQFARNPINAGAISSDGSIALLCQDEGNIYLYDIDHDIISKIVHHSKKKNIINYGAQYSHKIEAFDLSAIRALETNQNGTEFVAARATGVLEFYTSDYAKLKDEFIRNEENLIALKKVFYLQNMKISRRPINISSFYHQLPRWIQSTVKKKLNVRTGWGLQSTIDLMRNNAIPFRYKLEAAFPYVVGASTIVVGGYFAAKKLLS